MSGGFFAQRQKQNFYTNQILGEKFMEYIVRKLVIFLVAFLVGIVISKYTRAYEVHLNTVPVEIKGVQFNLLKSLNAPGIIILNNEASEKIELKDTSWFSPRVSVVGQTLKGKSQKLPVSLNGRKSKKAKVWNFGKDYVTGYDGIIGISALAEDNIVFYFSSSFPAKPTHVIYLQEKGGRFRSSIEIAGQTIEVRFDFNQIETTVNRKTGDLLVSSGYGKRSETLVSRNIAFGFKRPLEKLIMKGFDIKGLKVKSVLTRVSPTRASYLGLIVPKIKDNDEIEEIIVQGKGKKKKIKYKTKPYIVIGKEWLGECGKVVLRKELKRMDIYCS